MKKFPVMVRLVLGSWLFEQGEAHDVIERTDLNPVLTDGADPELEGRCGMIIEMEAETEAEAIVGVYSQVMREFLSLGATLTAISLEVMQLPSVNAPAESEEPVEYIYPVPLPADRLHPMVIPLINGVIAPLAEPFGWYMGDWQPEMCCFVGPIAIHLVQHGDYAEIKMIRGSCGGMLGLDAMSIERLEGMFARLAMLTEEET